MKKIFKVSEKAFLNEKNAQTEAEITGEAVIFEQIKELQNRRNLYVNTSNNPIFMYLQIQSN